MCRTTPRETGSQSRCGPAHVAAAAACGSLLPTPTHVRRKAAVSTERHSSTRGTIRYLSTRDTRWLGLARCSATTGQTAAGHHRQPKSCNMVPLLQHTATCCHCCNMLHDVAACCTVLQHAALPCGKVYNCAGQPHRDDHDSCRALARCQARLGPAVTAGAAGAYPTMAWAWAGLPWAPPPLPLAFFGLVGLRSLPVLIGECTSCNESAM